jgi:hypothetical protein
VMPNDVSLGSLQGLASSRTQGMIHMCFFVLLSFLVELCFLSGVLNYLNWT